MSPDAAIRIAETAVRGLELLAPFLPSPAREKVVPTLAELRSHLTPAAVAEEDQRFQDRLRNEFGADSTEPPPAEPTPTLPGGLTPPDEPTQP